MHIGHGVKVQLFSPTPFGVSFISNDCDPSKEGMKDSAVLFGITAADAAHPDFHRDKLL